MRRPGAEDLLQGNGEAVIDCRHTNNVQSLVEKWPKRIYRPKTRQAMHAEGLQEKLALNSSTDYP